MNQLIEFLKSSGIDFLLNEPMSRHTTFKIGGAAAVMVLPKTKSDISAVVKQCVKCSVRCIAVGNGSNLLVSDDGINACVILLSKNFGDVYLVDENTIFAQSGASLTKVCRFALEHSLSGLEFAYGIPGSCGGAAFMNAGAYGGELKSAVTKCEHIDKCGNVGFLEGNELEMSYRHSAYYENGCIITGVYFSLKKVSDKSLISSKMDELMQKRKDKQPLEYPSAGSTFKRPQGHFAGALIEQCGLKGETVGGAQISEKHAGFVINKGSATCSDVLNLCKKVSDTVYNETGVRLEMEVRVTD